MKLKFRAELKDIVIFLIFCVVLLYFVSVAVVNVHSFALSSKFTGLNPIPAFQGELLLPTLVIYFLVVLAIMLGCSSYFFEREEGFGITTEKKTKKDGYSKLLTEKEMKKEYGIKKVHLKDDNYDAGGIPVINDGKDAWVDDSGQPHALIMGASGSGKTQAFMFPLINILGRHGESMIVTDPKGELYEECGNLLKEKGYKIILINFRDPKEGAAWNPFSYPYRVYKEGNVDKANELLQDLASNILIDPNNKAEPFWEQTASNFFTGLSLGLFDDAKEAEININSINMMAEVGEDRVGSSTYIKEYFRSKGELSPAYIAAASCINAPNETRGGIMSTFRTKTRIFSSQEALSEMLSYSDFDIRDIGKEKTAVFLKIHDEKTTYHALATIFVKQAYEALIATAQTFPNLKLPYRTNFILDEFANMPALKDVGTMITASRSRNIRFCFAIQNFSQLTQVYGKEVAETIKGNCGNFVYIMTTELAALEEVSKLLGDKKPEKAKKDEPAPPIRPLFTVSDLQALKEGEVIINRFRSMPFKTKLTYNWKIDWGRKYEHMGYTEREHHDVQVFDLKKFVADYKEKQGTPIGNGMPGMGGMPMGMPGMGGMPGMNPMANPFMQSGPVPGGSKSGIAPTSLDDYIKKLDEKIAELEKEEAEEKAKQEAQNNSNVSSPVATESHLTPKTEEEIQKEISNILDHKEEPRAEAAEPVKQENKFVMSEETPTEVKPEAPKNPLPKFIIPNDEEDKVIDIGEPIEIKKTEEIYKEDKPVEVIKSDEVITPVNNQSVVEEPKVVENKPQIEGLEKPKVNIDVDSVVVNNNDKSEDFFDDFFGSEGEQ